MTSSQSRPISPFVKQAPFLSCAGNYSGASRIYYREDMHQPRYLFSIKIFLQGYEQTPLPHGNPVERVMIGDLETEDWN